MVSSDVASAYQNVWSFNPPKSCIAMHDAGLFTIRGKREMHFETFEVYDVETIAEGDAFVRESLVDGLVPIGGDRTGDRWCFDTRMRIHGTTPVLYCPHDGGGGEYVAPSFAAFVFRLIAYNLTLPHLFEGRGVDRAGIAKLTKTNVDRARPWLLRRWCRRLESPGTNAWPTDKTFDDWLREDPSFARLPDGEIDHMR